MSLMFTAPFCKWFGSRGFWVPKHRASQGLWCTKPSTFRLCGTWSNWFVPLKCTAHPWGSFPVVYRRKCLGPRMAGWMDGSRFWSQRQQVYRGNMYQDKMYQPLISIDHVPIHVGTAMYERNIYIYIHIFHGHDTQLHCDTPKTLKGCSLKCRENLAETLNVWYFYLHENHKHSPFM